MLRDCTSHADRECAVCRKCAKGQYMVSPCNATHDTVCASCTPEDQVKATCQGESFIVPCSDTMDARY